MNSYREYLKSEHWKNLRKQKFQSVGKKCSLCNCNKNLHVHHITYRTPLTSCTIYDLQVICAWCHANLHGKNIYIKKPLQFRRFYNSKTGEDITKRILSLKYKKLNNKRLFQQKRKNLDLKWLRLVKGTN